jgi:hypothetical protein
MIKKISIVLAGGLFFLIGCYNDKEELLYGPACNGATPSYATEVSAIIQTNCAVADCHAAGSTNGPGPLTNYSQISNAAVEIKSAVVSRFMPQKGSLSSSQIKAISCWVDSGAPNN